MKIVRRPPIWAWLGVVAALAVVIGLVIWGARNDRLDEATLSEGYTGPVTPDERPEGTTGTTSSALREYLEFTGATGRGEQADMGREHEYAAEGLRRLAAALESVAAERPGSVQQHAVEAIENRADRIQRDPDSAKHAAAVREAFMTAAEAIGSLDRELGAELRALAQSIAPREPLLEQRDAVREFFRKSAQAIQRVSRGA